MKNKKVSIKIILLIIVILTSIGFVLIKINNKNTNIEKQEISKEQLTQTTGSNSYVTMADHLSESNAVSRNLEIELFNNHRVDYNTTSRTLNLNPGKYMIITGVGSGGTYKMTIDGAEKIIQFSKNGTEMEDTVVTSPLTYSSTSEPHLKIESNEAITVTLKQTSGASVNYSTFTVVGYNY